MEKDPKVILESITAILSDTQPLLQIRKQSDTNMEVAGKKETMQGKQKVDGIYFASAVLKPKDVRLYFFPIYTHADAFADIADDLRKCLKGKSCFHIKKLDVSLEQEIKSMVNKGLELYQADDWI